MTSISVDESVKREFDDMKPDDMTHSEFVEELLAAKRRDNGEVVDVDAIVNEIQRQVASSIELASYRGTQEALDSYFND